MLGSLLDVRRALLLKKIETLSKCPEGKPRLRKNALGGLVPLPRNAFDIEP